MGVHLALDDFGTGYSSLNYLNRLSVHWLKIDRSFVSRLNHARTRRLVHGIVDLAYELGLGVAAEGVETREQAAILRAMGCDELQGFLYARPLAASEISWERLREKILASGPK